MFNEYCSGTINKTSYNLEVIGGLAINYSTYKISNNNDNILQIIICNSKRDILLNQ